MIRFSHKVQGFDRLKSRLAGLPGVVQGAARDGLRSMAESAAEGIRQTLGQSGAAPSRPGGLPADPAGTISAAVTVSLDPDRPRAEVVVDLPYAADLEFGTRRMAARPFLRPVAQRAGHEAKGDLAASIGRAMEDPLR